MEPADNRVQRYEAKYTIDEAMAREIRDFIQPAFSLDRHACPETGRYTVNNLYLDSPDRRLYTDTKHRKLRRFKLRVRYYGQTPEGFLVLEVKRRYDRVSWKHRRRVDLGTWPAVMAGPPSPAPGGIVGLEGSFEDLAALHGAAPVVHVRYSREPWVSDIDDYGRVTFDRCLRYRLAHGSHDVACDDERMIFYDDPVAARSAASPVVLEVKTENFAY